LVGNGGGYGYGVMGATHHALEDYGTLLALDGLRAFVPAFDGDVTAIVPKLFAANHPSYLRLGLSEEPKELPLPAYAPWRKLLGGGGATLLVVGPLVGGIVEAVRGLEFTYRPDVWLVSELPFDPVPEAFLADVQRSQNLLVIEEHVARGGVGQMIAHHLLSAGTAPRRFASRAALGYVSGRYGSQKFHRRECGLDPAAIVQHLTMTV
jgi:transketolase